jgi:GNAT superfamily N-acetyltransferase
VPRFSDPDALSAGHVLAGFDCGVESLNIWLQHHAAAAAGADSARTFVTTDVEQDQRVVGYHALTVASVEHADAAQRVGKGMPRHPIPCVLLARLAVDQSVQGQGVGAWLLRDAMSRSVAAAEEIGIRALLVHALGDEAAAFYIRYGFDRSPTDPHNLQMLIKDIRRSAESALNP